MTTLSIKTIGVLALASTNYLSSKETLRQLLMRSGIDATELGNDLSLSAITRLALTNSRDLARSGDDRQHRAMLDFIVKFVEHLGLRAREELLPELEAALVSDGYLLKTESDGPFSDRVQCRLYPTEPSPVPLVPEMTALEAELASRGYIVALHHYQSAIQNLADGQWEPSNGMLRSTFEELCVRLAVDHVGYTDSGKASQAGNALNELCLPEWDPVTKKRIQQPPSKQGKPLPAEDGGRLLRGVWGICNPNGAHPGLSDAEEARLRMQLVTGVARFLLRHFPRQP
ncbi:hypothetical protein AB0K52_22220 [Glycomyces sp. NPDC049804]|uniref:hypothetical protein n=1 Tax=Glycomyces sp. NPDC049804 TaxID=3154363 RepID=UPI00344253A0